MTSALFWAITQRVDVTPYRRFRQPIGSIFISRDGTAMLSLNGG